MDPKALELILASLATANDDQLNGAFAALRAQEDALLEEAKTAPTAADKVAKLNEVKTIQERQNTIRAEVALRLEAAEGIEALSGTRVELPEPKASDVPAEGEPAEGEPAEGTEGEPEGEPAEGAEDAAPEEKVLAGVTAGAVDAHRATQDAKTAAAGGEAQVSRARKAWITTGVATADAAEGSDLTGERMTKVASTVLTRVRDAVGRTSGAVDQIEIARVQALDDMDPEQMLSPEHSPKRNTELMWEAIEIFRQQEAGETVTAKTAAPCLPLNKIAEIESIGDASDWLDGLIPRRNAIGSNLGFQFNRSMGLAAVDGAVAVLDYADIDAIDPDDSATWKPCAEITCPPVLTGISHEITGCVRVPDLINISRPEWVAQVRLKLDIATVRARIQKKLALVDAESKGYIHTGVSGVGAKWDAVDLILRLLRAGKYDERLSDEQALVLMPPELMDILYLDEMAKANGDIDADMVGDFNQILGSRVNARIVVMGLDNGLTDPSIAQANGNFYPALPADGTIGNVVPGRPCDLRLRIWYPQALVQWTTGEFALGFQAAEQALYRTNRTQMFQREYDGIAKLGAQPLMFADLNGYEFGARSGLVTAPTCEGAAS